LVKLLIKTASLVVRADKKAEISIIPLFFSFSFSFFLFYAPFGLKDWHRIFGGFIFLRNFFLSSPLVHRKVKE